MGPKNPVINGISYDSDVKVGFVRITPVEESLFIGPFIKDVFRRQELPGQFICPKNPSTPPMETPDPGNVTPLVPQNRGCFDTLWRLKDS